GNPIPTRQYHLLKTNIFGFTTTPIHTIHFRDHWLLFKGRVRWLLFAATPISSIFTRRSSISDPPSPFRGFELAPPELRAIQGVANQSWETRTFGTLTPRPTALALVPVGFDDEISLD
ncbi:hypothetical protein CCACVL1_00681, partial [Corchorus capsularis]